MLSLKGLGAASGEAGRYYIALARDDYYTEGGEPPGEWMGQAAAALGLAGRVDPAAFHNVLRGFNAAGDFELVQGAGKDHYAGWDLCFNAPKSVSVLWATSDPGVRAAIQSAQREAVAAAIAFAEQHCAVTRRGRGGERSEPAAGLLVATFEHSTSREQDPHLHTHCVVSNLVPREDGSFGTLDGRPLYRWHRALGPLYRAELAHRLQTHLSLVIERDGTSFALTGVPQNVQREFSKRSGAIQAWLDEHGYEGAKAAEAATLLTRDSKAYVARPALFERWQAEGQALGWGPEQAAGLLQARAMAQARPLQEPKLEEQREGLVAKHSTFAETDIWRVLAEGLQGIGGIGAVEERKEVFFRDPAVVALGPGPRREPRWSTEAMCKLEAQAIARAVSGASQNPHALAPAQLAPVLEARPTASPEQREAVRYLCETSGAVAAVVGLPGTGKSFLLEAAREAWEGAGYRTLGAAPSGKAAEGLEKSSGIPSATLASRLLQWPDSGALDPKTVVVLDEAGMVDSRDMSRLIELTQNAKAKLVLMGDHRQLAPIGPGAMFRAITQRIAAPNLNDIRRQDEPWMREATTAMAGGRASEALAAYFGRGFVHVGENKPQTMEALIAKWAETGARAPGETRLILAGERADVRALNIEARRHLQNEGVLEKGQKIPTSHGPREFALGDRLVCTRNSKLYGVKNGHLGTVEAIDGRAGKAVLQVRLDGDGRRVSLPVQAYPHIDHGYAITTHKAQGATVDHSFILAGGQLADRELGLVQLSRHRKGAHLFADSSLYRDARLAHHLKPPAPSAPSDSAKPLPWLAPQPPVSSMQQTPPPATRLRETMEALAAELQVSHQKDTTQDYGRSRLQDREQELE